MADTNISTLYSGAIDGLEHVYDGFGLMEGRNAPLYRMLATTTVTGGIIKIFYPEFLMGKNEKVDRNGAIVSVVIGIFAGLFI